MVSLRQRFGHQKLVVQSPYFKETNQPVGSINSQKKTEERKKSEPIPEATGANIKIKPTDFENHLDMGIINQPETHAEKYTQTGEAYDEFIIMASINGLDTEQLFVPGERTRGRALQLHTIDVKENKICKITLSNPKKRSKVTKAFQIQAVEFLPADEVERFLPFNCLMKLEHLTQNPRANLTGSMAAKLSIKQPQKISEINLNNDLHNESTISNSILTGYSPSKKKT